MPPNSEKELTPIRLREATLAGDAWPQSRLTKQEDRRAEFLIYHRFGSRLTPIASEKTGQYGEDKADCVWCCDRSRRAPDRCTGRSPPAVSSGERALSSATDFRFSFFRARRSPRLLSGLWRRLSCA